MEAGATLGVCFRVLSEATRNPGVDSGLLGAVVVVF